MMCDMDNYKKEEEDINSEDFVHLRQKLLSAFEKYEVLRMNFQILQKKLYKKNDRKTIYKKRKEDRRLNKRFANLSISREDELKKTSHSV